MRMLKTHMREFIDVLVWKNDWQEQLRKIKTHAVPFAIMVAIIMFIYGLSIYIMPGWTTWALSSSACFIIGITALARVNDISVDKCGPHWQSRRLGFTMVGAACLGLIFAPAIGVEDWPSWREVMFRWGICLVLITSQNLPPWWPYISGTFRTHRPDGTRRDLTP